MKIQTTEAVRRWNAQVELADFAVALSADTVHEPSKLLSLLSNAGHHELRTTLQEAGARLNYWAPDGGPAANSRPAISETRTRSQRISDTMREVMHENSWRMERTRILNVLRLCVARLEEYPDAAGGTAMELARRELR